MDQVFDEIKKGIEASNKLQAYKYWQELIKESQKLKKINQFGFSLYSMHDQDGILKYIFDNIGRKSKVAIEFGCGTGLQNNSMYFVVCEGWKSLWIDGAEQYIHHINEKIKPYLRNGENITATHSIIERTNVDALLKNYVDQVQKDNEIDLLVIDIDWNDYYAWEAIESISPRVVCIEYNSHIPYGVEMIAPYSEGHNPWNGGNFFGSSLSSLIKLGKEKGYELVSCSLAGSDAIFVKKEETFSISSRSHGYKIGDSALLYEPPRFNLCFNLGHYSHGWGNEKFIVESRKQREQRVAEQSQRANI